MKINIALIRTDGQTQPRERLDTNVVSDYAEMLDALPPVTVFREGNNYWLADGFHRHAAHVKAKLEQISADVRNGTVDDARLFAAGANAAHGLRRTIADKRRAVRIVLWHPLAEDWSDRQIATHCGVSHTFVARSRLDLNGAVVARSDTKPNPEPATLPTDAVADPSSGPPERPTAKTELPKGLDPDVAMKLLAAIAQSDVLRRLKLDLDAIARRVEQCRENTAARQFPFQQFVRPFREVTLYVWNAEPFCTCPEPHAGQPGCRLCASTGWLTRGAFHNSAIPKDHKQACWFFRDGDWLTAEQAGEL